MGNKLTGPVLNQKNDLLQLSNSGNGITASILTVCDGAGNSTALGLSSTTVQCANIKFNGTTIDVVSGALTVTPATTFSGAVTCNTTLTVTGTITLNGSIAGSNITGSGNLVLATSPTLTTPTIASIKTNGGLSTVTLPTTTDTLVGHATTDTLTNKTLTNPVIASLTPDGTHTVTIPAATDTLVGRATTDTLTNKTLTSPVVTTPTINSVAISNAVITQINVQRITATGAFTYTKTAGTQYAIFELQGAGGGSGGAGGGASAGAVGGGGGGGGYLRLVVSGSANLAAITGSVGTGGTAGDVGITVDGGAGGNTTLVINAGTTWTAGGGHGGSRQGASSAAQANGGYAGGTNTTGTNGTLILDVPGEDSSIGIIAGSATVANAFGSRGGGSFLAKAVSDTGLNAASRATAGKQYGGGAAGCVNGTGSNLAGAAGANGVVIITEFISA